MSSYLPLSSSPDFSDIEKQVLLYWNQHHFFEKSVEQHNNDHEYVFYDGPPFANGLPHYGHLLTGYIKDADARYRTMIGHKVERRFGWDCHGLPAEMATEKELGISGRIAITDFGIEKFNAHCQQSVLKYTQEWEQYVTRQARWVQFKNSYKTMDKSYMESVMWAFQELYKKGLIYQDVRVMPYSWACETPLSNFETRMDNAYRQRQDKAVTVAFKLQKLESDHPLGSGPVVILAWTTTPWTLPSNLALAVNPTLEYSIIDQDGVAYILSTQALAKYKNELHIDESTAYPTIPGHQLVDLSYLPLFPYFNNHAHAFRILAGDFVTDTDGTGIVHMAPGFGEDDFQLCRQHQIDVVCPVDNAGLFTTEIADFAGRHVFDANDDIIRYLKEHKSWIKTESYLHNYPHCWRTDTPLIYKAVPSWYVKVTAIKDRMVELNHTINWIPGHVRDGLFGKWLENARDWSISRNRFWGTPIPVWLSTDPLHPRIDVYGSIAELERDFGVTIADLHKPFIDQLTRPNPDDPTGKSMMVRVPDVFDCWFESGSMPFAQAHYPFENKEWFDAHFPADFIVEYAAQTRGWFYTLMVLGTALFDKPPFKHCICHGVILDEKGQKLSKRLNNYADPMEIFATHGADALRWLMLSSPVMRGQELLIDKEGRMVRDTLRLSIKPLWNAVHFFTLYANADAIQVQANHPLSTDLMDRYILAKLRDLTNSCRTGLDQYDYPYVTENITQFLDILNNWYIRRSRERFWKATHDRDKESAYETLFTTLHTLCRLLAPLLPLTTEAIFQALQPDESWKGQSVHLSSYPPLYEMGSDHILIQEMDLVREVCNAALSIRHQANRRVRLPLATLTVAGSDALTIKHHEQLIADEVNVKQVVFTSDIAQLATYKLQLHFPILGKRLPHKIKSLIPASKKGEWSLNENGQLLLANEILQPDEYNLVLETSNPETCQPLASQKMVVALDIAITDSLRREGIARDMVRLIQQSRKEAELYITDRIELAISSDNEKIIDAITHYRDFIQEQTLALQCYINVPNLWPTETHRYTQEEVLEDGKVALILRLAS